MYSLLRVSLYLSLRKWTHQTKNIPVVLPRSIKFLVMIGKTNRQANRDYNYIYRRHCIYISFIYDCSSKDKISVGSYLNTFFIFTLSDWLKDRFSDNLTNTLTWLLTVPVPAIELKLVNYLYLMTENPSTDKCHGKQTTIFTKEGLGGGWGKDQGKEAFQNPKIHIIP